MIIAQINALSFGSTGKIMLQIADVARENGHECYTFSSKRQSIEEYAGHFYIDHYLEYRFHYIEGSLLGDEFHFSVLPTLRLIRKLKTIGPDVIHLHILHGYYLNLPILFNYLKTCNCRVIWTLHDCWCFTGRCPHFIMEKCEKWQVGCHNCTYGRRKYPGNFYGIDLSSYNFKKKEELFLGFKDLTIVTPSQWLARIVKQSFLKDYPVRVINNGINLSIFYPRDIDKNAKGLANDKYVILGVANAWGERKGLDIFIELAHRLDFNYQLVLIGTSNEVDQMLPENIVSVHHTRNQSELAEYYSIADLFINPTREDTFPTVNMEALACGTPVVTFDTGGSAEILDECTGAVVAVNDIEALLNKIKHICENQVFEKKDCVNRSKRYDMNQRFLDYIRLYSSDMTWGQRNEKE